MIRKQLQKLMLAGLVVQPGMAGNLPKECWRVDRIKVTEEPNRTGQTSLYLRPCNKSLDSSDYRIVTLNASDIEKLAVKVGAKGVYGLWDFQLKLPPFDGYLPVGKAVLLEAGVYKLNGQPVSQSTLLGRAATALSQGNMPDYDDLDPREMTRALNSAFGCRPTMSWRRCRMKPEWLKTLSSMVRRESRGRAIVRPVDCRQDSQTYTCTGHGRQHTFEEMVLVREGHPKIRFNITIVGARPFEVVSENSP